MDEVERRFIRLYAVEGKSYSEIERELDCDRGRVRELFDSLAGERGEIRKIRDIFSRKRSKDPEFKNIEFVNFYEHYEGLTKECCYCGIREEEIKALFDRGKIKTKRQFTRGRRLELERIEPKESYKNFNNLVLACYWCNNAKSDEFSAEEFKPIANLIGSALRARLSS